MVVSENSSKVRTKMSVNTSDFNDEDFNTYLISCQKIEVARKSLSSTSCSGIIKATMTRKEVFECSILDDDEGDDGYPATDNFSQSISGLLSYFDEDVSVHSGSSLTSTPIKQPPTTTSGPEPSSSPSKQCKRLLKMEDRPTIEELRKMYEQHLEDSKKKTDEVKQGHLKSPKLPRKTIIERITKFVRPSSPKVIDRIKPKITSPQKSNESTLGQDKFNRLSVKEKARLYAKFLAGEIIEIPGIDEENREVCVTNKLDEKQTDENNDVMIGKGLVKSLAQALEKKGSFEQKTENSQTDLNGIKDELKANESKEKQEEEVIEEKSIGKLFNPSSTFCIKSNELSSTELTAKDMKDATTQPSQELVPVGNQSRTESDLQKNPDSKTTEFESTEIKQHCVEDPDAELNKNTTFGRTFTEGLIAQKSVYETCLTDNKTFDCSTPKRDYAFQNGNDCANLSPISMVGSTKQNGQQLSSDENDDLLYTKKPNQEDFERLRRCEKLATSSALNSETRTDKTSLFWISVGDICITLDVFYNSPEKILSLRDVFNSKKCDGAQEIKSSFAIGIDDFMFSLTESIDKDKTLRCLPKARENCSLYWFTQGDVAVYFCGKFKALDQVEHLFNFIEKMVIDAKQSLRCGVDDVEFFSVFEKCNRVIRISSPSSSDIKTSDLDPSDFDSDESEIESRNLKPLPSRSSLSLTNCIGNQQKAEIKKTESESISSTLSDSTDDQEDWLDSTDCFYKLQDKMSTILEVSEEEGFQNCSKEELNSYAICLSRYAEICLDSCLEQLDKVLDVLQTKNSMSETSE